MATGDEDRTAGEPGGYDSWAAEGRPEHLRPLDAAGHAMFDDPVLRDHGIVVFSTGVDVERELLWLDVAALDAEAARNLIAQRYAIPFELEVVAPTEYVREPVPWDWWSTPPGLEREICVWLDACVDDAGLEVALTESRAEIVVTLHGAVYQGNVATSYSPSPTRVTLAEPVGNRTVIDGTTGEPGARRPPR